MLEKESYPLFSQFLDVILQQWRLITKDLKHFEHVIMYWSQRQNTNHPMLKCVTFCH